MPIKIIERPITKAEALEIGKEWYGEMVKGVVDVKRGIVALGGEYHMDANNLLVEQGSAQEDIWGFNIYPARASDDWIEYLSLINIRPAVGNQDMEIHDQGLRDTMKKIIEDKII